MEGSLEMSDEDFLNSAVPPEADNTVEDTVEESTQEQSSNDVIEDTGSPQEVVDIQQSEPQQRTDIDYKDFYDKVLAPFNANGKTITLQSADEAIQLMQMGANYTLKMQSIAPYRKLLLMLENNNLLDEGKLSFLIDLDKKDPEAIKKLIKDSGIEPLEIDTDNVQYQEGSHKVTDQQAAFHAVLDDIKSTPEGIETLRAVNQWDKASKDVLYSSPDILTIIDSQRRNGVYERIVNEMNRRKVLGSIQADVPFLQAYKVIGDEIKAAGGFNDLLAGKSIATTVTNPKSNVGGNSRANAASVPRGVSSANRTTIRPLAMSDDDFLKQMASRV